MKVSVEEPTKTKKTNTNTSNYVASKTQSGTTYSTNTPSSSSTQKSSFLSNVTNALKKVFSGSSTSKNTSSNYVNSKTTSGAVTKSATSANKTTTSATTKKATSYADNRVNNSGVVKQASDGTNKKQNVAKRDDFANDNDYERYLTQNKVNLSSGDALNYVQAKAKEQGVSARDYAVNMHTKVSNTLETESMQDKARQGKISKEDNDRINQFGVIVDENGNELNSDEYNKNLELYNNNAKSINSEIEKLSKSYAKGEIDYDTMKAQYDALNARWDENESVGNSLRNAKQISGFDYYDWAKANGKDVSKFEEYVESFNDSFVENLAKEYGASVIDAINIPVQTIELLNMIGGGKDFTEGDSLSSQLTAQANELREYAMAGTDGFHEWSLQALGALMPQIHTMVLGLATGGALGLTGQALQTATNTVSLGLMGQQTAGQVVRQRLDEGNDLLNAVINGITHGAITAFTEKIGGEGIASIFTGGAGTQMLSQALLRKASFGDIAKFLNQTGLAEGNEEIMETLFDGIADSVQNVLIDAISGGTAQRINTEQINVKDLANEFVMAYAGALVMGAPTAGGVVINSKQKYNAGIEAKNYFTNVLNSEIAMPQEKEMARVAIDKINYDLGEYEANKSPVADAVELPSDAVAPATSYEEAMNNLANALRPDVQDQLASAQETLNRAQDLQNTIQESLYERGIDIDANEYLSLSTEEQTKFKDYAKKLQSAFPDANISYSTKMGDNGKVNLRTGKIEVNPLGDTPLVVTATHEVIHTIENTPEYQQAFNELFKNKNDFLSTFNNLSSDRYSGDDFNTLKTEAFTVKLTEELMGEKGANNFIDHLAKYNTNLAYKLKYKFEDALGMFENNSLDKITSLLTKALDKQDIVYLPDGKTSYSKIGTYYKQVDEVFKKFEDGTIDDKDLVNRAFPINSKDIKEFDWAKDLGLPDGIGLVSINAVLNSQYDSKDPSTNKWASGPHSSLDKESIDPEIVKHLDVFMAHPYGVFKSKTVNGALVLLLKATTKGGSPIVVSLNPWGIKKDGKFITRYKSFYDYDLNYYDSYKNKVPNNGVTSFYGKNNGSLRNYLNSMDLVWADGYGDVRSTTYADYLKIKNGVVSNGVGLQLSSGLTTHFDDSITQSFNKAKQLAIIEKTNPMLDDYHTGVREVEDILTFDEAMNEYGDITTPDYTEEDMDNIRKYGYAIVYSSYPIKDGVFVTPSRMEAQNYAGNGKVYQKFINVSDVAWIDSLEGQYAKITEGDDSNNYQDYVKKVEDSVTVNPVEAKDWANMEKARTESKYADILKDAGKLKVERIYKTKQIAEILKKTIWDKTAVDNLSNLKKLFNLPSLSYTETLANKTLDTFIVDGGAKSVGSATNKVIRKVFNDGAPDYNLSKIKDANRYTVKVKNVEELYTTIKKLKETYDTFEFELKIQDRDLYREVYGQEMDKNIPNSGYVGFHGTFVDENGIVVEVQTLLDFLTKDTSDKSYDSIRNKKITPEESDDFYKSSRALWNDYCKRFGITPEVLRNISSLGIAPDSIGGIEGTGQSTQTPLSAINSSTVSPSSTAYKSPSLSTINPSDSIITPLSDNNIVTQEGNEIVDVAEENGVGNQLDTQMSGQDEYKYSKRSSKNRNVVQENTNSSEVTSTIVETDENGTQRFATNSIPKSQVFTNAQKLKVAREVAKGAFSYQILHNKPEYEKAVSRFETKGQQKSFEDFMNNESPSVNTVIDGEVLVAELAKQNDPRWEEVAGKLADDATILGQALQAYSIMQRMTPDGQLVAIQRNINRMQRDLDNKLGNRAPDISLTQEQIDSIRNAKNVGEIEEAKERIYRQIVDKTPKTVGDIIDSWRYLAMLGNPRTHIRNVVGNAVFVPAVNLKNAIGVGLEKAFGNLVKTEYNTKAFLNRASAEDQARLELGRRAYDENKGSIEKGQKYEHEGFGNKTIIGKVLNWLNDKNSTLLDKEDYLFSRARYSTAFAQFMKANNLTEETLTPEWRNRANSYAMLEAQKATYRDANAVAEWLNELEYSNKKGLRIASVFKKAILPFTKTPMNIVKRGVEYSPIGLMKTIVYDSTQLAQGKINPNTYLDNLASGMSGTMIAVLGALLSSMGIFHTKDDDKDRKNYFDQENGEQEYSIDLSFLGVDGTYTIDWATPVIMPLAIGAELFDSFTNFEGIEGFQSGLDAVLDISAKLADPVMETSMLSSLQDALKSYATSGGEWFGNIFLSMASSYVNQMFPTVGGQIARTIDDTRRTTYPNTGVIDKTIKQIYNKIPGLSMLNEPFINKQGQEEKTEDLGMGAFGRAFLNMISPGYYSSKDIDKYDEEMYRLYEKTGIIDVFPSSTKTSTTYDNETYKFTDKEYTKWHKDRYQAEQKYVNDFIDSDLYKSMSDDERAETIKDIREYAGKLAKNEYLDAKGIEMENKAFDKMQGAIDAGVSLYDYFGYKNAVGQGKQADKAEWLNDSVLTDEQKEYIWNLEGYKTSYNDAYKKAMKSSKGSSKTKKKASTKTKKLSLPTLSSNTKYASIGSKTATTSNGFKKAYANVMGKTGTSSAKGNANSYVVCPNCKNEVSSASGYCPVCGSRL